MRHTAKSYCETMPDFVQGKLYFSKSKYRISRDFFKRALIKDPINNTEKMVNIYLNQKLAESCAFADSAGEAEIILDNIINNIRSLTSDKNHIFEHYNNLMTHCMHHNLDRAIS
jgi:hypothetical protein